MISRILFFLILCVPLSSQAWMTEATVTIGAQGEFRDQIGLYCRPDETLCQEVCQSADSCWKEQELCYNCLGTTNPLLRTVYTELDRLYRNDLNPIPVHDIARVFTQNHIFVAARSIYNFYSAIDNAEVLSRFQKLCPAEDFGHPLVVLEKNHNHEPIAIKYVLCDRTGPYNQGMFALEYRPQVDSDGTELNLKTKP